MTRGPMTIRASMEDGLGAIIYRCVNGGEPLVEVLRRFNTHGEAWRWGFLPTQLFHSDTPALGRATLG